MAEAEQDAFNKQTITIVNAGYTHKPNSMATSATTQTNAGRHDAAVAQTMPRMRNTARQLSACFQSSGPAWRGWCN
jgi:hypothetical protein